MTEPARVRSQRRPGVMSFSYAGPVGSRQMDLIEDLAAAAVIRPQVVPIGPSAAVHGARFSGATAEAYVARATGLTCSFRAAVREPKTAWISNILPSDSGRGRRLWIGSDACDCDIPYSEPRRSVSVMVPVSSVALDLSPIDLAAGVAVEASPIAWNSLNGLIDILAGDVEDWVIASAAAVDQYLIGVAGLVFASVLGSEIDGSVDYDRARLRTRALALIEAQFQDPWLAPTTIASKLGVSLRSLHRAFEGSTGVADELRVRRVEYASALLADVGLRRLPIAEVARRAGFTSMATFGRSFGRTHEESPHAFRKAAVELARSSR